MAKSRFKLEKVTLSYVHIIDPRDKMSGEGKEYSCQILLPKKHPQIAQLKKEINALAAEEFKGVKPSALNLAIRDCDAEGKEPEGHVFLNARRREDYGPPPVYSSRGVPISEPTTDQVFSGVLANVVLTLYTFNFSGKKGVTAALEGVQIVDNVNVKRLDGGVDLSKEFTPLDDATEKDEAVAVDFGADDDDIPF